MAVEELGRWRGWVKESRGAREQRDICVDVHEYCVKLYKENHAHYQSPGDDSAGR